MPVHPFIVHLPMGLALVIPLVATGLAIAMWRDLLPYKAFAVVVGLQAIALGGGFVAYETGGKDHAVIEKLVKEKYIEAHEEAAELFMWLQGLALAMSGLVLIAQKSAARAASLVALVASLAVAAAAVRAGQRGGRLVYEHGAAAAFVKPPAPPPD